MADPALIPSVWCIDVEPDEFAPDDSEPRDGPWTGFEVTAALVDEVRAALEDRSGRAVVPTWLLRMDPMIEQVYGRPDFAVAAHRDLVDAIVARGDGLGVHVHPYRWDPAARRWFSDHADPEWMRHCIAHSVAAFEESFGFAPATLRMGGYILDPTTIDIAVAHGLRVDLTVEPGLPSTSTDPSHGAYANAPSTDFREFARNRNVANPPLLLIPLSATDIWSPFRSRLRTLVSHVMRRGPRHLPLSPWREWASADTYWDLMRVAVSELDEPHVAFAIRTLPLDRPAARHTAMVMRGLPDHGIGDRLEFLDPVALIPPELGRGAHS